VSGKEGSRKPIQMASKTCIRGGIKGLIKKERFFKQGKKKLSGLSSKKLPCRGCKKFLVKKNLSRGKTCSHRKSCRPWTVEKKKTLRSRKLAFTSLGAAEGKETVLIKTDSGEKKLQKKRRRCGKKKLIWDIQWKPAKNQKNRSGPRT